MQDLIDEAASKGAFVVEETIRLYKRRRARKAIPKPGAWFHRAFQRDYALKAEAHARQRREEIESQRRKREDRAAWLQERRAARAAEVAEYQAKRREEEEAERERHAAAQREWESQQNEVRALGPDLAIGIDQVLAAESAASLMRPILVSRLEELGAARIYEDHRWVRRLLAWARARAPMAAVMSGAIAGDVEHT